MFDHHTAQCLTTTLVNVCRDGKNYVVMNSWMPAGRPVDDLYDLKGCADDKLIRKVSYYCIAGILD